MDRFLGVTVMPEYIQNEGVDGVLDRLRASGVTAVATSPYVMEPAGEKTGSREPPDDSGAGSVRLLDRPLWGKRELFVRTAPSYAPDKKLYHGLSYQPAGPAALTKSQGGVIREFLRGAQSRHMKTYLQVQAAIPPGYRVQFGGPNNEDRALLPDGRLPPRRLANNGSLASPEIRGYTEALLRDLLRAYPEVDGLRVDWPEYPPYFLDDVFLDFSAHARAAARRMGIDFDGMQRDTLALYKLLHGGLQDGHLAAWLEPDGGRFPLLAGLAVQPGILDLLRFKAQLVDELLAGFRKAMNEAGSANKELMPNAFPPPFTLASGMDFARAARHSTAISVKLYTMHWPMMLRFWGDVLKSANRRLNERLLVQALAKWMDIVDGEPKGRLADWSYPEPDVPHPVGPRAQARKIRQAQRQAGPTPVIALAHGYGPAEDFRARLQSAWRASQGKVWINRYAYLSDLKVRLIGEVCR